MRRVRYGAVLFAGVMSAIGGAFLSLGDIHTFTASLIYGVEEREVQPEMRKDRPKLLELAALGRPNLLGQDLVQVDAVVLDRDHRRGLADLGGEVAVAPEPRK